MDLDKVVVARSSAKLAQGVNEWSTFNVSHGATFEDVSRHPSSFRGKRGKGGKAKLPSSMTQTSGS